jgi:hypothetical protein
VVAGLPPTKYLVFGGLVKGDPKVGEQMISDFLAPVEKEFAALGAEAKPMQDYIAALKAYMGATRGWSFGWVAPSGMLGQEAILQVVSVIRGEPDKILQATQQMFASQQQLMQMIGGANQPQVKTNFIPNAKTVDGVTLNQMQTTFVPPAAGQRPTPQQMQAQQMMAWMYGPGGMNAYIGKVGEDKAVMASGANDALLQQLVAAAKADDKSLVTAPHIAATDAKLPKQRVAAWYVQIDQIASSVANYAKAFGMPINFQVPQNLSPAGGTLSTEGPAVKVDGYMPAQTMQSVIAAVMQTYMQMQGGQQPGGAEGPGGPGGL